MNEYTGKQTYMKEMIPERDKSTNDGMCMEKEMKDIKIQRLISYQG